MLSLTEAAHCRPCLAFALPFALSSALHYGTAHRALQCASLSVAVCAAGSFVLALHAISSSARICWCASRARFESQGPLVSRTIGTLSSCSVSVLVGVAIAALPLLRGLVVGRHLAVQLLELALVFIQRLLIRQLARVGQLSLVLMASALFSFDELLLFSAFSILFWRLLMAPLTASIPEPPSTTTSIFPRHLRWIFEL